MNIFKLGDKNRTLTNVVGEKNGIFRRKKWKKNAQAPSVHDSCG
jgi:hypothetical protein